MDDALKRKRPHSRKGGIAGLMLLILGTLIWLRLAWMILFYGPWFRIEEWIRFVFWVWVGGVLELTGLWLRYQSRVSGWAAVISVPGFFGLVLLVMHLAR